MPNIIPCILGPTASGKTFLATELAKQFPIEIISVDSRQVYRKMDIGTAKPSRDIMNTIPHHLIDIRDPDEQFTAGQFVDLSVKLVEEILSRRHIPLFTGGTGMYILALEEGLFQAETDPDIRKELHRKLDEKGLPSLYEDLKKVDPVSAGRLHPNDKQRILRALEVYYSTGQPISFWQQEKTRSPFGYPLQKFILFPNRQFLYEQINQRVLWMMEEGLIEEVQSLLKEGYTENSPGLRSVGYQETIRYIRGEYTRKQMIEEIQKNTRRYAKRQFTWFKKHGDEFLEFDSPEGLHTILSHLKAWFEAEWKDFV